MNRAYAAAGIDPEGSINIVAHSQGTIVTTAALAFDPPGETYKFGKSVFLGANLHNLATESGFEFSQIATGLLDVENIWSRHDHIVTIPSLTGVGAGNGGFLRQIVEPDRRVLSHSVYDSLEPDPDVKVVHALTFDPVVGAVGWWDWLVDSQSDSRRVLSKLFALHRLGPEQADILGAAEEQGNVPVTVQEEQLVVVIPNSGFDLPVGGFQTTAPSVPRPTQPIVPPALASISVSPNPAFLGEFVVIEAQGAAAAPGRKLVRADVYLDLDGDQQIDPGEYLDSDHDPRNGWRITVPTMELGIGTWEFLLRVADDQNTVSVLRTGSATVQSPGSPPPNLPSSLAPSADSHFQIVPHRDGDVSYDPAHYFVGAGKIDLWEIRPATGGGFSFETTGDTDTLLGLYDRSSGELIEFDEDNGAGANAEIVAMLDAGVAYVLAVVSQRGDSGSYGLHVTGANQVLNSTIATPPPLYGGTVAGAVNASYDTKYYRVDVPANADRLNVRLGPSATLDGFVRVESFAHETLRTSFLASAGDDGRIQSMPVTGGESLYVTVTGVDGTTGTFNLEFDFNPDDSGLPDELSPVPASQLLVTLPDGTLQLDGESFSSGGEFKYYFLSTATSQAGDFVIETSGDLDTQLGLYRRLGSHFAEFVAEDDDSGAGQNARLSVPLAGGEVYVLVVRADGLQTGDFGLLIAGPPESAQPIVPGGLETVATTLPDFLSNGDRFRHYGVVAPPHVTTLDITAEVLPGWPDLDIGLRITNSAGQVLAHRDEAGAAGNEAALDVAVDPGATYFISVWSENLAVGDFRLQLDFDPDFDGGVGVEFSASSSISDLSAPDVAMNSAGESVVAWRSYADVGYDLRVQRFSAGASAVGTEILVAHTDGTQLDLPRVAIAPDGRFVIGWLRYSGSFNEIAELYFQPFNASGVATGAPIKINGSEDASAQWNVDVNSDGKLMFVWSSFDHGDPNGGVFARMFTIDGAPIGSEFQVNTATSGFQGDPDVASSWDGSKWLVVYQSAASGELLVAAQLLNTNGAFIGAELIVDPASQGAGAPSVAGVGESDFLVAWVGPLATNISPGVNVRRVAGNGELASPARRVNELFTTMGIPALQEPMVAGSAAGQFAVVWGADTEDGQDVVMRQFSATGAALGPEFVLNQNVAQSQRSPAIASDGAEDFFAVWSSDVFPFSVNGIVSHIGSVVQPILHVTDSTGVADDRFIDFGGIEQALSVLGGDQAIGSSAASTNQTLTITNTGNAPLSVSDLEAYGADAGYFVIDDTSDFVLQPGESRLLGLTFQGAEPREYFAAVRFTHNDDRDVLGAPLNANPFWISLLAEVEEDAEVNGRHLFYNKSKFDGGDIAANAADDSAIATDKIAYLPSSGLSTTASVSSYSRGINGLMIDVANLDGPITADDFTFRVGSGNSPDTWALAPAPLEVVVRPGAGVNGSDRVTITWADGAIKNTWLQVTVEGNDAAGGFNTNTGLAESDVFYFGSRVGDTFIGATALATTTNIQDELAARFNPGIVASPNSLLDFNRDGLVNIGDQLIARNNSGVLLMLDIDELLEALVTPAAPQVASIASDNRAADLSALAFSLAVDEPEADEFEVLGRPLLRWRR